MTKHRTEFITASLATLLALFAPALLTRADIFEWEYINPANPSQGKQQSTILALDGAGAYAVPGANLSNRDLTKAYLIQADLGAYYDFESYIPSNLTGVNLSQADLTSGSLSNAYLGNANLSQANLTNTDCTYALLTGANLTGAEIRGAEFQFTSLSQAQLYSTASYENHDLTGLGLRGTRFHGVNLTGQNLTNANIAFTTLTGANLSQANLTSAQLVAADARGANLSQANLTNANLSFADIRGANVLSATFTGAITTNLIKSDGYIAGLNLASGAQMLIRDYDGNPAASPPIGPLPIIVDQHFAMDANSTLVMRFDADVWDSTISFAPGIPVARGGTLALTFVPEVNFASQIGRTFDLFDWTGVAPAGMFNVTSEYEYTWDLSKLYTTGEVTLTAVLGIVPGDFNGSGTVDAADYVVWRKNPGGIYTPDDYNTWRANFGQPSGSGSVASVNAAVPEPTTLVMLIVTAVGIRLRRRDIA